MEALKDVVFRVHPVTDLDAEQMVRSIRSYRVLQGIRGEPPSDEAAITDGSSAFPSSWGRTR